MEAPEKDKPSMDQCTWCLNRGDTMQCESVECAVHTSWYALTLKSQLAAKDAEMENMREDTMLLDRLESLMKSGEAGNGIALFPYTLTSTGQQGVSIDALGDQDGSDLGDPMYSEIGGLRDVLRAALKGGE